MELFAVKVRGFQCKATATKSSTVDIPGVPDPPLITTFDKVSFNLTQATVISFSSIVIYGRSYLCGSYEVIFY